MAKVQMNPLIRIQIGGWNKQKKCPLLTGTFIYIQGLKPGFILSFTQPDGFDDFAGRSHQPDQIDTVC